jgi:hypothetical protein
MDFFTVPTLTFGVLHCFSVIGHDRRKILYFNVTRNPQALWVVQQLREAWSYKQPNRFLLFDRDTKFGAEVVSAVRDMGSEPTRTSFRSPWQNGVAERWAGSCRRDLLDHVIILNERHLKRLLSSYLLYYHEDRTHLGLAKDAPAGRPTAICSKAERKILPETRRAAPSLCSGSVDSRANLLKTKLIFLKSGQGTVHVLCEYFSPVDESACNPKPKGFRQAGRKPFNVGHNGLANYS